MQRERLHRADNASVFVFEVLFVLSLAVMLINYFSMKKWEQKATEERDQARMASFRDNRADDNMYKRKEQLKSMGADARD